MKYLKKVGARELDRLGKKVRDLHERRAHICRELASTQIELDKTTKQFHELEHEVFPPEAGDGLTTGHGSVRKPENGKEVRQ